MDLSCPYLHLFAVPSLAASASGAAPAEQPPAERSSKSGATAAAAASSSAAAKPVTAAAANIVTPETHPLGTGPFSLGDFEVGVTLGTGSFGRVRFCTHKAKKTHWAIKILKKAEIIRMQQVRTAATTV